jgi:hypothetical protein
MWGSNIDDVNIWVGDEFSIGAVGGAWTRDFELRDEFFGAGFGGGRGNGDDCVGDIMDIASLGVEKEVFNKCWV